ncbi:Uncharacterised protein [Sphingobacterium daejeonense]|nr:Uncharacterised protein [Sphingobacterium daejeonense]
MVKDVSDYTLTPYFQLMNRSIIEVLSIASMMIDEAELNSIQINKNNI